MCRSIKTLFNFEPPATDTEIRAASLQFVRKISGFAKPSKFNEAPFNAAVDEIEAVARRCFASSSRPLPDSSRPGHRGCRQRHAQLPRAAQAGAEAGACRRAIAASA